jgi:hypothetical protein
MPAISSARQDQQAISILSPWDEVVCWMMNTPPEGSWNAESEVMVVVGELIAADREVVIPDMMDAMAEEWRADLVGLNAVVEVVVGGVVVLL